MNNQISDANFSEFKEQSEAPSTVTEPSLQTLISPAKDNNKNTLQSEENLPTETSTLRAHENNDELSHNLHTIRNFLHMIITLSQDFLTSLNKKEDTNTSLQSTTTEVPKTQPNMQQSLMNKLTAIHEQIARIHQLQSNQEKQRQHKKPETRACFRCGKIGHVAKICRSKLFLQNKQLSQTNQGTYLHRKQTFIRQRQCKQSHPTDHNSSAYDPLHNWQLPTLQTSPQKTSLTPATHSE